MGEQAKYDLKQAYNRHLDDKARLHYIENYEHDVNRRGEAGNYTGNHPRYSRQGISMVETPLSPMKESADLEYMPVEDIAGQGTEGVNMKANPIMESLNPNDKAGVRTKTNPSGLDPSKYHRDADLTQQYPRRKESDPLSKTFQEKQKKGPSMKANPIKMGHKSPAKMGKSPVKEQKYGGNKGDLRRSAKRDY